MPYVTSSKLDALIEAGTRMSCVCYNVKQNKEIPTRVRDSMEETQTAWDVAIRALRSGQPSTPSPKRVGK